MIRNSDKMAIVAGIILDAADEGRYLTIAEIYTRLPYQCIYGALRKTLTVLEKRNWIEKERAGSYVFIKPRSDLYAWFRR